jgi:hypothetical protein
MQYKPDTTTPISEFIIGKVLQESVVKKIISPSIHVMDRRIVIEQKHVTKPRENGSLIDLYFASGSYIHFDQGKTYLFAISGENCVGFLEVLGDRLILPDKSLIELNVYKTEHRGHPFPDYYGYNDQS